MQRGREFRRKSLAIELLSDRFLMAVTVVPAIDLEPEEQLILELTNRGRANPTAEASRFSIDLNSNVAPGQLITAASKPPLAPQENLKISARGHSVDMVLRDYFLHDAPNTVQSPAPNGVTFANRIEKSGYPFRSIAENIAYASILGSNIEGAILTNYEGLFKSASHRLTMLSTEYVEVGVGTSSGQYSPTELQGQVTNALVVTQDFGVTFENRKFITGVAYDDSRVQNNQFYNLGEGVEGTVIEALNSNGDIVRTTTGKSGAYALPLSTGTYVVSAKRGAVSYALGNASVTTGNTKLDLDFSRLQASSASNLDVDRDNLISPLDVLSLINFINSNPNVTSTTSTTVRFDVNGNSLIEPVDVLIVINELNRRAELERVQGGSGEGEIDNNRLDAVDQAIGAFDLNEVEVLRRRRIR